MLLIVWNYILTFLWFFYTNSVILFRLSRVSLSIFYAFWQCHLLQNLQNVHSSLCRGLQCLCIPFLYLCRLVGRHTRISPFHCATAIVALSLHLHQRNIYSIFCTLTLISETKALCILFCKWLRLMNSSWAAKWQDISIKFANKPTLLFDKPIQHSIELHLCGEYLGILLRYLKTLSLYYMTIYNWRSRPTIAFL